MKLFSSNNNQIVLLNTIVFFVKLVSSFLVNKITALILGTNGLAFLGNFRTFLSSIEHFSLMGIHNGIVALVSKNSSNKKELHQIYSRFFWILLLINALIVCCILFFKNEIYMHLFNQNTVVEKVFYSILGLLPIVSFSTFLSAFLTGLNQPKRTLIFQIISSFFSAIVQVFCVYFYQLNGAFSGLIIGFFLQFFMALLFLRSTISVVPSVRLRIEWSAIKPILPFVTMALFSGVLGSLVWLKIKTDILVITGIENAGIYEAAQRISSMYLLFVSSILSLYFYPKFITANAMGFSILEKNYFFKIIPLFLLGLVVIYLLQEQFIPLFFSNEFSELSTYLKYYLLADFFRAMALFYSTWLVAKQKTIVFIVLEICSLGLLYFLNNWLLHGIGIKGAFVAYLSCFLVFFVLNFVVKKSMKRD